jgi:hypothetical protein
MSYRKWKSEILSILPKTFARVRKQSTYGIGTTNAASLDEKESRKEEKTRFIYPYVAAPYALQAPIPFLRGRVLLQDKPIT